VFENKTQSAATAFAVVTVSDSSYWWQGQVSDLVVLAVVLDRVMLGSPGRNSKIIASFPGENALRAAQG